ncbi:MAG: sugar ABC transporter substrate-binding protein [Burkholderiales bacterium]|jgi:ribose transport system substrate-binding protein
MKLAVFTKNRSNPAYAAARLGADRAAARLGAHTVHYVPERSDDPVEQSALIEQALAQDPDAVLLAPVHPTAVNAAIRKVNSAGVPLVAYISRLTEGQCVSFVGSDDYALAFKIAHYLLERLAGKGEVVIVEGPPESVTSVERVRAFRAAAAAYPGVRIVAACSGHYLRQPAREAMARVLAATPRVDAILAANDSMAIGALEALLAAGRSALLAGVNAIPEAIAAIKSGAMAASADFNAMNMASLAAECAIRHLRGESVPKEIILPVQIVDRSNCSSWDSPYEKRKCLSWGDALDNTARLELGQPGVETRG